MFTTDQYQLIDFGNGRRLERFGGLTLDRQCPAAERMIPADPTAWQNADARFEGINEQEGEWICSRKLPDRWTIAHGNLRFELKRTPFGHIGLFPEQAENWDWLNRQCRLPAGGTAGLSGSGAGSSEEPALHLGKIKVLNLFAYTGGSTLAAAAAGAEVVHVDAAKNIVEWAQRNAELSGLAHTPIHWITEDAMKFVKRELKRGNRYDAVILDPPSYGHGRRGEVWRLSKHLPRLLELCGELTAQRCRFLLLTCHTPGYEAERLADMLKETFPDIDKGVIEAKTLTIHSAAGQQLPSGSVVRWTVDGI